MCSWCCTHTNTCTIKSFNSTPPGAAYIIHCIRSVLVQTIIWTTVGLLSIGPLEKKSEWNFDQNKLFTKINLKHRLQNDGHFVQREISHACSISLFVWNGYNYNPHVILLELFDITMCNCKSSCSSQNATLFIPINNRHDAGKFVGQKQQHLLIDIRWLIFHYWPPFEKVIGW